MSGRKYPCKMVQSLVVIEARQARVRALLESMFDWVPGPRAADLGDVPGPAPSSKVPCHHCRRTGKMHHQVWGTYPCPICLGTGWRRKLQDDPEWDIMVERPMEEVRASRTGTPDPWEEEKRLTASIDRIQRTLDAKEGRIDHEQFSWERHKEALERHGDYRKVRAALHWLNKEHPRWYRAVMRVYRSPQVATDLDREYENDGTRWMARIIGGDIRVPSWIPIEDTEKRKRSIEEMMKEGLGAGAIARRLGIQKRKVRKIMAQLKKRR